MVALARAARGGRLGAADTATDIGPSRPPASGVQNVIADIQSLRSTPPLMYWRPSDGETALKADLYSAIPESSRLPVRRASGRRCGTARSRRHSPDSRPTLDNLEEEAFPVVRAVELEEFAAHRRGRRGCCRPCSRSARVGVEAEARLDVVVVVAARSPAARSRAPEHAARWRRCRRSRRRGAARSSRSSRR